MAWMLCEELVKWVVLLFAGFTLNRVRGVIRYMTESCMIKGCMRLAASDRRGLCLICYGKAKKKVDSGETTWERLEAMGLCKPSSDPFDTAYDKATHEDN